MSSGDGMCCSLLNERFNSTVLANFVTCSPTFSSESMEDITGIGVFAWASSTSGLNQGQIANYQLYDFILKACGIRR